MEAVDSLWQPLKGTEGVITKQRGGGDSSGVYFKTKLNLTKQQRRIIWSFFFMTRSNEIEKTHFPFLCKLLPADFQKRKSALWSHPRPNLKRRMCSAAWRECYSKRSVRPRKLQSPFWHEAGLAAVRCCRWRKRQNHVAYYEWLRQNQNTNICI